MTGIALPAGLYCWKKARRQTGFHAYMDGLPAIDLAEIVAREQPLTLSLFQEFSFLGQGYPDPQPRIMTEISHDKQLIYKHFTFSSHFLQD